MRQRLRRAVAVVANGEGGRHFVADEMLRRHRIHFPDGGTRREHFHQREAQALHLVLHGFVNHLGGLHDPLVVAQAHALQKHRRFQRGQHFADMQRVAIGRSIATERRRGALLAERRSGGHLPARHAVDAVVHEDDGDGFAAIGGMHDLRRADRCQVAIALVGHHHAAGTLRFTAVAAAGARPCATWMLPTSK